MKHAALILALALALVSCSSPADVQKTGPALSFREDGTFKIMQVTDTHLSIRNTEAEFDFVFDQIDRVLQTEKPDLLVFTGDIVTSQNTYDIWQKLTSVINKNSVPFIVTYGNHDREEELSDRELPRCYANDPLNLNILSPEGYLEDVALGLRSASGDKTSAVIYVMDSGDYSNVLEYSGYGWFSHDQVHWYMENSRDFASGNGNVPVPSYAFFHIPVVEYYEAYNCHLLMGVRGEKECPGSLNSGILSAFEENGDVHGIFVGHDHDNDYIAREGGIACVYGRCGFFKEEGHVPGNGIRIIELREGDYGFRTWVREEEGMVDDFHFDVPLDMTLRQADDAGVFEPGLVRTMYSEVAALSGMEQDAVKGETSIVPTPRMINKMGEGDYGAVQEGYLYVPETGAVTFELSVADEGMLVIDDVILKNTDGSRGQVKLNLEKGYHPVKFYMLTRSGGGCWTKLMWKNQFSGRFREIPAGNYYHK